MNIKPTTSVSTPLGGEVNQLEITVNPFELFPTTITISWKVIGPSTSKEGTLVLPQYIVNSWGTDDNVVKDYVLFELGLLEETTTTTTTIDPLIV
jgi:hypothetical protein